MQSQLNEISNKNIELEEQLKQQITSTNTLQQTLTSTQQELSSIQNNLSIATQQINSLTEENKQLKNTLSKAEDIRQQARATQ